MLQGCVPQPKSETEAEPSTPQQKQAIATPNPAKEAVAEAVRRYPALSQKDSALNRKFVALFEAAKAAEPDALTKSDWPLVMAARADAELRQGTAPSNTNKVPIMQGRASQTSLSPADIRKVEQAATEIYGRVAQSNPNGCFLRVNGFSGGPWIAQGAASAGVAVSSMTIFVEGVSSRGDGEQFQDLKIFPTGQFVNRGGSTLRLYTNTAQTALQRIQEGGKSVSEVISADHSMWLHQQSGPEVSGGDFPVSGNRRLGL